MCSMLLSLYNNVYIAVRSDCKAVKDTWQYDSINKGYITPKNTFQRFYDENLITELFGDVEYVVNNSSLKLFRVLK